MTLVDEQRRGELLGALDGHLVEASHASGGSAGNSVIATALFGGPCYMSCRVADDEDGRIYLRDLDAAGIRYPRPAGDGTPTGKCLVLVTPDAERSMNTFLGASEQLSTEQLDEEAIARSDFLYLEGYLVTSDSGRAAAIRAREIAQAQGVPVALSFSDPGHRRRISATGCGRWLAMALTCCSPMTPKRWAGPAPTICTRPSPDCKATASTLRHHPRRRRCPALRRSEKTHEVDAHARRSRGQQRRRRHVRRGVPLRPHPRRGHSPRRRTLRQPRRGHGGIPVGPSACRRSSTAQLRRRSSSVPEARTLHRRRHTATRADGCRKLASHALAAAFASRVQHGQAPHQERTPSISCCGRKTSGASTRCATSWTIRS
jgi:hypothetical protein